MNNSHISNQTNEHVRRANIELNFNWRFSECGAFDLPKNLLKHWVHFYTPTISAILRFFDSHA